MRYARIMALLPFLTALHTTLAYEVRVTGYGTNEFAVKGAVFVQLESEVVAPIRKAMEKMKGVDLEITIVGFADKTGMPGLNDRLGKERAEEAKAFLLAKFPQAKINTLTRGDELNNKMVVVQWKLVLSPKPALAVKQVEAQEAKAGYAPWLIPASLVIAVLASLTALVAMRSREAKRKDKGERVEWIDTPSPGGRIFSVPVMKKPDGNWYAPIPSMSSPDKFIFQKNLGDIASMVKGCFKEKRLSFYGPVFSSLLEKGVIREVTKEGNGKR